MEDGELKASIFELTKKVEDLTKSIDSLTAISTDLFNNDQHDIMQTLNGSLQELIKLLEQRPIR